jgi:hypothetical protein
MLRQIGFLLVTLLSGFLMPFSMVYAQYTSPSYKVDETFFGAGGELELNSAHYQAKVAAGELGVDHATSSNYQTYAGFNTTAKPLLEVYVTGGTFDLGLLSTTQVKAITAVFTVRSYLSSGYTVGLGGTSPKNSGYALTNLTSASSSSPGTEQFGVNLAANTLTGPGSFGAVPSQVPDSTFGFGVANAAYNTTNLFKYVENDTIAHSNSSSGVTQYTLSAIANIAGSTPGGSYGTSLFVNVVPTF